MYKISPHKMWIKKMLEEKHEVEKRIKKNSEMFTILKGMEKYFVSNGSTEDTKEMRSELEKVASLANDKKQIKDVEEFINLVNVLMVLEASREIYLKGNVLLKKMIAPQFLSIDKIPKKFTLPFSEIVITFENFKDFKGYVPRFLSVFKNSDVYTKDGKDSSLYTIKESIFIYEENKYGVITDFMFILEKLPRIFLRCPDCSKCDKFVDATPIFKDTAAQGTDLCMKTIRTADICPRKPFHKETSAQIAFHNLLFVTEILEIFSKRPIKKEVFKVERKTKVVKDKTNINKDTNKDTNKDVDEEPVIIVDGKNYKYLYADGKEYTNRNVMKRSSPVEHPRQAHKRRIRLKTGEIIIKDIPETTVNPGGKKAKYVIQG